MPHFLPDTLPDTLARLVNPGRKKVVAITGSGGKTTLLWYLAQVARQQRVLVSTTTKLFYPPPTAHDFFLSELEASALPLARAGITLGVVPGSFSLTNTDIARAFSAPPETAIKLLPLSTQSLQRLLPLYDHVFIECDGSRMRPLKGWAGHEPPVPPITDVTVGVLPLWCVGKRLTEGLVHRPDQFCAISGATMGERLSADHVTNLICHPQGMFRHAVGERVVFFSQSDALAPIEVLRLARDIAERVLPQTLPPIPEIRMVAGSARTGTGAAL